MFHNYFKRTARKDWKAANALTYYLQQNVPVKDAYDLIEIALKKETMERKTSIKSGNVLMKELKSAFEVIISNNPSIPTSNDVLDGYKLNMLDQDNNRCLNEVPKAQAFLKRIINGDLEELVQTIYTYKFDETYSSEEKQVVNLLKYIMSDYHANCERPAYYTDTNDRTP